MNKLHSLTLAFLASAAVPATALAGPAVMTPPACPTVTIADVEAQFDRFSEAWATLNPDAVTALFTAEPVLLATVSNQPRTTPAGVRDYFAAFLRNTPVAQINSSTTEIDCRTASRVGTWTVMLTDPVTAAKREVKARYTFIYRFEEGVWKIDHLHSSAMPEGAAPSSAH